MHVRILECESELQAMEKNTSENIEGLNPVCCHDLNFLCEVLFA